MDTAWNDYAAAAPGAGAGRARTGGYAPRSCARVPRPPPRSPPVRDGAGGWGERELGWGGVRVVPRWGWGGAGWGDACLLTKENEWDTLSRPAPPRSEGRGRGSAGRGRGGPFIHSWPLRRRRRSGRAGSRALLCGEERGRWRAWGRSPRARVPRRKLRRHVSAGERKRGAESAGTGGDGAERARQGASVRACKRGGEGRPLVPERPRTTLTEAGGGGRRRRRSWRRAGAEGVSERSGRAREGREGKGGVTRRRARALGARSEASGTGSGLLPAA